MAPRIHLGVNTCFAVKRWPEPEQWLALVAGELGLRCCQFSLDLVDPLLDPAALESYARDVRRQAAAAGVQVHSTFSGLAAYSWSQLLHPEQALREAAMRWYERAIAVTAELGATATGGHVGAFSVRDAADPARRALLLAELRERVAALSRRAKEAGLQALLWENMAVAREWGHSIAEAQEVTGLGAADGVPVVLCLDVGHPCALRTGPPSDDYLAWLDVPWAHTPILHLQQTDRTGDHHWPFTDAYNARGLVRPAPIVAALRRWSAAEDIYLFIEAIHPFEAEDAQVLHDLRASVQYWQDALAQPS